MVPVVGVIGVIGAVVDVVTGEVLEDETRSDEVRGLHTFTKAIHTQDIGACESVWSGLNSPSFDSGRLSTLEKAIWQFNQWWTERMVLG